MAVKPDKVDDSGDDATTQVLALFVAGDVPISRRAASNLREILESARVPYSLETVDVHEAPERAVRDMIVVVPTLVRRRPEPPVRLVGDLSDREIVLDALGVDPA